MKIIGIGADIVNIKRIEKICKKNKDSFLKKIFTKQEIKTLKNIKSNQNSKIATRFAAKEAFSKALGTGFGKNLSFLNLEVLSNEEGKPYFLIKNKKYKNLTCFLTISDDYPWALAFVVLSK